MDSLDKKIITRLLENCRESYHNIARELGVSCPTITARVDKLRQWGVIQRFTAEISHETLGIDWVLAEIQTNKNESKSRFLGEFESHACIGEVLMLGGGHYIVLAEIYPEEKQDFMNCLKSLDDIEYIEVSNIHPISNGIGRCKFTSRGDRIQLTKSQVDILQHLTWNARIPVTEIADCTGYSQKFVSKVVQHFSESNGVNLTLRLNLTSCGKINFLLRTRLKDMNANPLEISNWVSSKYPEEHWFAFYAPRSDSVLHYMTAQQPTDIQNIIQDVRQHSEIEEVEGDIVFSMMKSDGRSHRFVEKYVSELSGAEEAEYSLARPIEAEIVK
jgi:DNA-binding Lrp family transcriptional regulator